jgi:hypothetical protein
MTVRSWVSRQIPWRINDYLRKEMQDNGGRGAPRGEWAAKRVTDNVLETHDSSDSSVTMFFAYEEKEYLIIEEFLGDSKTIKDFSEWLKTKISKRKHQIYTVWLSGLSMKATGKVFNVTESRVCQIIAEIDKLALEFGESYD